jgi:hypothetical protein
MGKGLRHKNSVEVSNRCKVLSLLIRGLDLLEDVSILGASEHETACECVSILGASEHETACECVSILGASEHKTACECTPRRLA